MPIRLSEFLAQVKTISVTHLGETVYLSYRVNAFNSAFIAEYYGPQWVEEHPGENRLDHQLSELITEWNLVDDDGNGITPSLAVIALLPLKLKEKIGRAMFQESIEPGDDEKKD